jgi:hypothetical protein
VADLSAEVRAFLVGVAEVESGEDARLVDFLDGVVEAVVQSCDRPPGVQLGGGREDQSFLNRVHAPVGRPRFPQPRARSGRST